MKSRATTHRVFLRVFLLSTLWLTALTTSAASTSSTTCYIDVNHPQVADSSDHGSKERQETATDEILDLAAFPEAEGFGANSVGGRGGRVIEVTNTSLPTTKDILTPKVKAQTAIPAFPGAEGFGAKSVGGRGGRVIEVTNLNDSGPGSLRAAIEAEGPRIVVFRVAGTIDLDSTLKLRNPYITIAGQTAPHGGITLRNNLNQNSDLDIYTHDVVIRYLRVRPGPGPLDTTSCCGDGIGIVSTGAYNIVLDHLSVSWAVDEDISSWYAEDPEDGPHDFTVQWCVISEGLKESTHSNVGGSGLLLGSESTYNASCHHNLFVFAGRNPGIQSGGMVDVVNNVSWMSWNSSVAYPIPVNYVGNYLRDRYNIDPAPNPAYYINVATGVEVFVQGNIGGQRLSDDLDESLAVTTEQRQQIVPTRHDAPFVTTYSCDSYDNCEAYDQVLAGAGATMGLDSQGNYYLRRDAVDKRVIEWIKRWEGRRIDAPSESTIVPGKGSVHLTPEDYTKYDIYDPLDADGWPILDDAETFPYGAYYDTDHDGMADEWEMLHFNTLERGSPEDSSSDFDGDGYTDLEEFLNGTNPRDDIATSTPTPTPQPTSSSTPVPPTPTLTPQPTRSPTSAPPAPTPTPQPTRSPTPARQTTTFTYLPFVIR